jgi:hypothetical protein
MNKPEKNYVMKFGALGDADGVAGGVSVFYRIACNCTDQDCDMVLEIEKDDDYHGIYLNIYKHLKASAHWGYTSEWEPFDFVRVFINKIRMCCRIMFKGYIEVSEAFIMREEKHIESFREALLEGINYVERREQNENESNDS